MDLYILKQEGFWVAMAMALLLSLAVCWGYRSGRYDGYRQGRADGYRQGRTAEIKADYNAGYNAGLRYR